MNAIYTTCTYNHIARAFSLADSVRKYSPNTKFLIGLIDKVDNNDSLFDGYELIGAEDLKLPFFKEMCVKYITIELNSALKPYFADYIFKNYPEVTNLIYLDSDILLFDDLNPVYESLKDSSIILTPHSMSSIDSDFNFDDRNFLRTGIFNSGFFGLKRDSYAFVFLAWWMHKLRNEGYINPKKGMFAEQLWLNLVPLYFERVHVLRHHGCNVAYWNLHERQITQKGEQYIVNGTEPLIFFHYSGASINCFSENNLSEYQNRHTFTSRPDVIPIFQRYIDLLHEHSFEKFNKYYMITSTIKTRSPFITFVVQSYKKVVKKLFHVK
ncbi:MAG TPA: glycosyl transferase [Sphingobacteriaceae bacterium]|nr:glycosyl transferase [Sphingobacteriaceae bacterium]